MSHFSVLVVTEKPDGVDATLLPFSENINSIPQSDWTFTNIEGGAVLRFESDNVSDKYNSFEEFMEKEYGMSEPDPISKTFGYWHNPKGKWIWWALGGRWSGFLRKKKGGKGIRGIPGPGDTLFSKERMTCDQVQVKNLNLDNMATANKRILGAMWDEAQKSYLSKAKDFGFDPDNGDDFVSVGKRFKQLLQSTYEEMAKVGANDIWQYIDQTFEKDKAREANRMLQVIGYLEDVFGIPFGERKEDIRPTCVAAYLDEHGTWHEPENRKKFLVMPGDRVAWCKTLQEKISNLNPELWVSIVDCEK